ncbi:hypothetical protein PLICRDRAFT_319062 [Plicaturopsis crispa FD-325 SS-3]|nr:hypothetical protein PLICRDRAFT_319062 [Plicaturopsis crispa FD-325 SS-3]
MTLLIHPTSTCDVCLEPYSWSTQAQTPHAIACGHVFCLNCLQNLRQPVCPLCRKSFQPDRAKRLHVDKFTGESDADTIDQDVFALMQRIALVSGEHQPEEQVTETIRDVEGWLNTQPGGSSPTSIRTLSASIDALRRYRLHKESSARESEKLREALQQCESALHQAEEDTRIAKILETRFLEQQQEHLKWVVCRTQGARC